MYALSSFGDPPQLHSFPTRRSSDLIKEELFTAEQGAGAHLNGRRLRVTERRDLLRSLLTTGFPYDLDRKSTRLNSSHPSISYAVFCLKKKIIIAFISDPIRVRAIAL